MDDPADLSSQDGSGPHTLDEGVSTRNRKVVGSNPTSGSISAGQGTYSTPQATGPAGQRVDLEERIAEILERYPPHDPVHRAITRSHPMLREAVDHTRRRLAAAADQPM
jgi:hypothetical protein